ncbi:MAG: peroxidase-related enzyme [Acidobacteriota bacterium]
MTLPSRNDPTGFDEPLQELRRSLGLLPSLLPARSLVPRIFEAERAISRTVLGVEGTLPPILKESILIGLAARFRNLPGMAAHGFALRTLGLEGDRVQNLIEDQHDSGLSGSETALLDFSLRLGERPGTVAFGDIAALRDGGWSDAQILDAILVTAVARFLYTLSSGLGAPRDPASAEKAPEAELPADPPQAGGLASGPYLAHPEIAEGGFAPFQFFRKKFGFVPNLFRAQTLRPDVLEAEARLVADILLSNDVLKRVQKEYILLALSGAAGNECLVAVHTEVLRNLGVEPEVSGQIAADYRRSPLSPADKALLDAARKLCLRQGEFAEADLAGLRARGFTEAQILEAVATTALTAMLQTLQKGLGTSPDFPPRPSPPAETATVAVNPETGSGRLTENGESAPASPDPDSGLVARARAGEMSAFEELLRRHQNRVYRTLLGLVGNAQDAEDGTQVVFLKVFRKMGDFGGAARFSTWLTRIAINEGIERLRSRKEMDSLDEADEGEFRPSRVAPWAEDPESRVVREEMRQIVQEALRGLPPLYRMAVMLRDIEQLSTAEAAEALDLPIPTLKTRLLRGRLMLREALAPRFIAARRADAV